MTVFDRANLPKLQADVLAGRVDSDTLLPDLVEHIDTQLYNL